MPLLDSAEQKRLWEHKKGILAEELFRARVTRRVCFLKIARKCSPTPFLVKIDAQS
jgi:hypothetical protein